MKDTHSRMSESREGGQTFPGSFEDSTTAPLWNGIHCVLGATVILAYVCTFSSQGINRQGYNLPITEQEMEQTVPSLSFQLAAQPNHASTTTLRSHADAE